MKVPPIIRTSFVQGVKTSFDPSSVPPDALYEAWNVRSDDSGILRLRRGSTLLGLDLGVGPFQLAESAFDKILGVWNRNVYLIDSDGSQTQIATNVIGATANDEAEIIKWSKGGAEIAYLVAGNGIFETKANQSILATPYLPATGEDANFLLNTVIGTAWAASTVYAVGAKVYANGNVYECTVAGTSGSTAPSGTGSVIVDGTVTWKFLYIMQDVNSGPARCTFGVLRVSLSQRIALSGDPQSPNTVYLSGVFDGSYYPSEQTIQLPDDGGKIIGLWNWYNALVILRDRDIWAFIGSDVTELGASLVLQDSSMGCIARRSIASVPNVGIVFLGSDNIYALQGVSGVEDQTKAVAIGDDVRKFLIPAIKDGLQGVTAIYRDQEYRISFPKALKEERVFRLNLQNYSQNGLNWYVDTGPKTAKFILHKGELYGTELGFGKMHKFTESLLDETNGIPYYVAFRREDVQGPSRIKRFFLYAMSKGRTSTQSLFFAGTQFNGQQFNQAGSPTVNIQTGTEQHLKISLVVDGEEFFIEDLNIIVGKVSHLQLATMEPVRIYEAWFHPSLKGHFVQVRVYGTTPEEDIAVLGYGIEYSPKGRIRGIRSKK